MAPEEGLAVIHFPSTLPEFGGVTDYNAWHEVRLRDSRVSAPLRTRPTYIRIIPTAAHLPVAPATSRR